MNNADKSVSLIDLDLRRRFVFIELKPNYDLLDRVVTDNKVIEVLDAEDEDKDGLLSEVEEVTEIHIGEWLQTLNQRIVHVLGAEGNDLQIGHSYFLSKEEVITEPGQFVDVLKYEIIPLLNEYTYNNQHQLKEIIGERMYDSSNQLRVDLIREEEFGILVEALME